MNYRMLRDIFAARPKSIVFIAFLALLSLALQLYLSLRQQPELEKAQVAWFAKRDALAKGEILGDSAKYQNGLRDLDLLQKRMIPQNEFPALLSRLYETAQSNSLALKGITFRAPAKGDALPTYGVSFIVSGRYASIKSFLADMVRYPELVTVDSVSLSNTSRIEELVDLRVQTSVYLKKEGA